MSFRFIRKLSVVYTLTPVNLSALDVYRVSEYYYRHPSVCFPINEAQLNRALMDRFGGLVSSCSISLLMALRLVLLTFFLFFLSIRWPFLYSSLIYIYVYNSWTRNIHRHVSLIPPVSSSRGERGKKQIVSACQTFFVASLARSSGPDFCQQLIFCFHHAFKGGPRIVLDVICRVRDNPPPPFFRVGWVQSIEDVHQ